MALRAYYEQLSRFNQLDRIELHDSEYAGAEPELQFLADETGFTRQWDEITSESNEKLINIQANRVQIGKYDFRPRIENQTGFDILEDIRDSDNKRFHIVHKIDGTFEWAGWVTTRIFSYPEKGNNFFAHIRATDFEILKGQDYTLDDTRQTFIDTFADLFSELPEDTPIKTATSWVEENVTSAEGNENYDFLNKIYHETKALREFGRTGDETDQPITKWDALGHVAEPGLLIRHMGGHVMIDQLTELADPENVNETVYDSSGSVATSTTTVDRRQTGYGSADNGTPSLKNTSENDTYPSIKRAKNKYNHRTEVSGLKLPSTITIWNEDSPNYDGDSETYSQIFISDGDQEIEFGFVVGVRNGSDEPIMFARFDIEINGYYLQDDGTWQQSAYTWEIELTQGRTPDGTTFTWRGSFDITTESIPANADGTLSVTFYNAIDDSGDSPDQTSYGDFLFNIVNPIVQENTTSIDYQLTQNGFESPEIIELSDTIFGDGPVDYSAGALRYDTGLSDTTTETWRRRGQTIDYRNYHWNLLAEVIDMGRTNMRKLEADIWGAYDPTKVLDYNGSYFYFAGGKYDGTTGKWRVTLMELNLQTDSSDEFEDIPKFTDETGSGGSATTSSSSGGLDQDTGDNRYFRQSQLFSEIATADQNTAIENLGITATKDELNRLDGTLSEVHTNLGLTDGSADLDLNSLSIGGDDLFSLFYTEQEINSFFDLYYSKADLTDGDEDLHLNSLEVESGKFLSPTSYQFRNAGDTDFRDVEMARLTLNDVLTVNEPENSPSGSQFVVTSPDDDLGFIFYAGDGAGGQGERWNQRATASEFIIENNSSLGGFKIDTAGQSTFVRDLAADEVIVLFDAHRAFDIRREDKVDAGTSNLLINSTLSGNHWEVAHQGTTIAEFHETDGIIAPIGGDFQDTLTGTDAEFSSTGAFGGLLSANAGATINNQDLTVNSGIDLNGDLLTAGKYEADNFSLTTDFSGTGHQATYEGDYNIRNLVVREAARFRHLIIDELGIIAGSDLRSVARGKVQETPATDNTLNSNQIILENPRDINGTTWIQNDFFWVKAVDVDGGIFLDLKGQVTNVDTTDNVITLTLDTTVAGGTHDGGTTDLSDLAVGNVLVQRGHPTDTDRQQLIYTTVSDSDAPVQKYFTDVDSLGAFDTVSNITTQIGRLDAQSGYSSISNGDEGFFGSNMRLTDSVLVGDLDRNGNYIEFDGSNINVFANNAQIGDNSGWLGSATTLSYSADTVTIADGLLTVDGGTNQVQAAGWDFRNEYIGKDSSGIWTYLFSEQIDADTLPSGNPWNGTYSGRPTLSIAEGDTADRIFVHAGETYSNGWTGRTGFSLTYGKDSDSYVEFSVDGVGDLTAFIAGANFDEGAMWAGGDGTKANATFLADWANKTLEMGSVFSADGGADTGQLSSLEVFPSHMQSADNAFRLGGQGLQMDTGASASSTQAIKWYDGGYNLSNLQHAIAPANTGLEVTKRDAGSGNLNVIAQFQDDYLNLPDGLRIQGGLLVALNLPTSDPQRQGQVWYDETNDKLTLSTPNDPVITAGENGTDEIIISLDNATTGPYDIIDASDDSVIANDVSMPYTHSGLDPDTEYCYYVTDNNGNDSNTDCATTLALSPEISCSGGTNAIQVDLDTPSTSPYTMYRNGSVYETGLVDGDFPYTDNFITGTYQYQLEDDNGAFSNTTECTAT